MTRWNNVSKIFLKNIYFSSKKVYLHLEKCFQHVSHTLLPNPVFFHKTGYHVAGEGNLIPSQWDYLGEERIDDGSNNNNNNAVNVPCRVFGDGDRYWRYCFHYVSISTVGTTDTFTKLCLPAKDEGERLLKSRLHCFMFL